MRRRLLTTMSCVLASLATACASTTTTELPVLDMSDLAIRPEGTSPVRGEADDVLVVGGPWERFDPVPPAALVPQGSGYPEGALPTSASEPPSADAREATALEKLLARGRAPEPPPVRRPPLEAPQPRSGAFLRIEGKPTSRTADELARDHVLDWPTRIEAREVTFYCPATAAAELVLRGDELRDLGANGPRVAYGRARMQCRELSIVAERITVRVLPSTDNALRIVARGDVRFAMRVRERVFQEDGLKSLMVLGDQLVPLP